LVPGFGWLNACPALLAGDLAFDLPIPLRELKTGSHQHFEEIDEQGLRPHRSVASSKSRRVVRRQNAAKK